MKYIVDSDQRCRPLLRVKRLLSGVYQNIFSGYENATN